MKSSTIPSVLNSERRISPRGDQSGWGGEDGCTELLTSWIVSRFHKSGRKRMSTSTGFLIRQSMGDSAMHGYWEIKSKLLRISLSLNSPMELLCGSPQKKNILLHRHHLSLQRRMSSPMKVPPLVSKFQTHTRIPAETWKYKELTFFYATSAWKPTTLHLKVRDFERHICY